LRAKRARTSKGGRPPAGIRQGERVRDYPQLSVRIPPDIRATVHALSAMRGQPQWRIVVDALKSYVREQSNQERQLLDEFMRGSRSSRGLVRNTSYRKGLE
jgi:hypothetical protein